MNALSPTKMGSKQEISEKENVPPVEPPQPGTVAPNNNPKKEKRVRKHVQTAWTLHVAEFRTVHPELSFKQVLQEASKTYHKQRDVKEEATKKE